MAQLQPGDEDIVLLVRMRLGRKDIVLVLLIGTRNGTFLNQGDTEAGGFRSISI